MFKSILLTPCRALSTLQTTNLYNNKTHFRTKDKAIQFWLSFPYNSYNNETLTFYTSKALVVRVIDKKEQFKKGSHWAMFSFSLPESLRVMNYNYERGPLTL